MPTNGNGQVSVVIPTFNRSALCKVAVESVLAQTGGLLEVIVVDDGSSDDTEGVIKGMDDRVRYVRQENAGVSAARNRGMEQARGEFIALLDSDDSWLPWKLEAQLEVFRRFPEAGMVWTDMVAVDDDGKQLRESYIKEMYKSSYAYFDRDSHFRASAFLGEIWGRCPEAYAGRKCYVGNIFPWMFMGNLVHTSTAVLRRSWQRRIGGFDVSLLKSGEDYDFHLRTCRLGDVAYMDVASINYRVGAADQLTSREYWIWMARNNLKTINKVLGDGGTDIGLPVAMIRKRMAHAFSWVGMCELSDDRLSARRHLRKAFGFSPFNGRLPLYYLLSFFPSSFLDSLRNARNRLRS
jgi:glycosyltransferase involved in cell wall biosynthesis